MVVFPIIRSNELRRACTSVVVVFLLWAGSTGIASSEVGEAPCIDCTMYEYGWQYASTYSLTLNDDCDFYAEDEDDRDFIKGCKAYISWKIKRHTELINFSKLR